MKNGDRPLNTYSAQLRLPPSLQQRIRRDVRRWELAGATPIGTQQTLMGLAGFKFESGPAELLCVDCETTYVPRGESTACPFCGGTCAAATACPRMPLSGAGDEARLVRIDAAMAEGAGLWQALNSSAGLEAFAGGEALQ